MKQSSSYYERLALQATDSASSARVPEERLTILAKAQAYATLAVAAATHEQTVMLADMVDQVHAIAFHMGRDKE